MSQSGYTPILIYASGTASAVPLAANMTSSAAGAELALNYADGKLYFKNSSGVVTLLATAGNGVTTFSAGTTGFTPSTATSGAVTLAGTLANTNGGTGQSSAFTQYGITYASTTTALATTAAGTSTTVLHGNASGAPTFGAVSLTADVSGTLPIANGGTNSTATPTAGGIGYGTGTAHAYTAVGTAGQALISAAAGAPAFGTLGVAGGGTGATTLTANNVLLGNGTSALQAVAPSTAGNVLTSNGTTWTSATPSAGFSNIVVLTSSNASYSIPAAKIKVTVVGGGGNAGGGSAGAQAGAGGGGGGGTAIKVLSGLTVGSTLNITVGAAAGTSSVASGTQSISTVSATGGTSTSNTSASIASGGAGGAGSGGDLNIGGSGGGWGVTNQGCPNANLAAGNGGASMFGGGVITPVGYAVGATTKQNGTAGAAYGGGGSGGWNFNAGSASSGGAGAAGVVIVEY